MNTFRFFAHARRFRGSRQRPQATLGCALDFEPLPELGPFLDSNGHLCLSGSVRPGDALASVREVPASSEGDDAGQARARVVWCNAPRTLAPAAASKLPHSCDPNAYIDANGTLRARFTIAPKTPLSINDCFVEREQLRGRSPKHFSWNSDWSFDCHCSSPACAKRIEAWRLRHNCHPLSATIADSVERQRLEVRTCQQKGRGVFAKTLFQQGELLESAPVILIPAAHCEQLTGTVFDDYTYAFGGEPERLALALGLGSLINHDYQPNAVYIKRYEEQRIDYFAIRPIAVGEEITINYNGSPRDGAPLWFAVAVSPSAKA